MGSAGRLTIQAFRVNLLAIFPRPRGTGRPLTGLREDVSAMSPT
jgi:hypothetical protein